MRAPRPLKPLPPLHELEAEIMGEVWRHGEATVQRVMDALNSPTGSSRAYTTYMTVMQRLDKKGLLSRTRKGRSDTYVPTLSKEDYDEGRAREQVAGLVSEYGDVALAYFARELGALDPERARKLRELAARED
jgi:predicted transcriptional regulator